MKQVDNPGIFDRDNPIRRYFSRHKRAEKGFIDFGIIWFTLTGTFLAFGAGVLTSVPGMPIWLPYLLLFYSPFFGYQVYKWSGAALRREFQERIERLEKRVNELESDQR